MFIKLSKNIKKMKNFFMQPCQDKETTFKDLFCPKAFSTRTFLYEVKSQIPPIAEIHFWQSALFGRHILESSFHHQSLSHFLPKLPGKMFQQSYLDPL
jgi:hypothetical protein